MKKNIVHNINYTTWIECTAYNKVLKFGHNNSYNQKVTSYQRMTIGTTNSQIKLLIYEKKLNINELVFFHQDR